jgi:hypothetical protein
VKAALDLDLEALEEVGLPTPVDARLAAQLAVVVCRGVQRDVGITHVVREGGRGLEGTRGVSLPEGRDELAVDLGDPPRHAALGPGVGAVPGEMLGLDVGHAVEGI